MLARVCWLPAIIVTVLVVPSGTHVSHRSCGTLHMSLVNESVMGLYCREETAHWMQQKKSDLVNHVVGQLPKNGACHESLTGMDTT